MIFVSHNGDISPQTRPSFVAMCTCRFEAPVSSTWLSYKHYSSCTTCSTHNSYPSQRRNCRSSSVKWVLLIVRVTSRVESRFCGTWSLYNFWGPSLRIRIQNYECKN